MITSRSVISDKIQDLFALEAMASELYKEALRFPESQQYAETLNAILSDELAHIELVRGLLERIQSEGGRTGATLVS